MNYLKERLRQCAVMAGSKALDSMSEKEKLALLDDLHKFRFSSLCTALAKSLDYIEVVPCGCGTVLKDEPTLNLCTRCLTIAAIYQEFGGNSDGLEKNN